MVTQLSTPCNGFDRIYISPSGTTADISLSTPCNGFKEEVSSSSRNNWVLSTPCNGFFIEREDVEYVYKETVLSTPCNGFIQELVGASVGVAVLNFQLHVMDSEFHEGARSGASHRGFQLHVMDSMSSKSLKPKVFLTFNSM